MVSQGSQSFEWHYAEFDDRNYQAPGHTLFYAFGLFAVVLLVALLFLYARWVCRYDGQPPEASHGAAASAPPVQGLPRGLDAAAIDKLPIALRGGVASGVEEAGECSICLGEFEDGEKVKALPQCGHCYHCACVDQWLVTRSVCPLCRAPLRVDSAGPCVSE